MTPTILEYLTRDHARLDALLAAAIADPQRVNEVAYTEFRAGLLRHIAMEEKVLFVDVRATKNDALIRLSRVLHADHAAIASLLVPPPTHQLIATLREVLEGHNPLEDAPDGLYEQCDRIVANRAADVIARMEAIPAVRVSRYLDQPRVHQHIERMLAARSSV